MSVLFNLLLIDEETKASIIQLSSVQFSSVPSLSHVQSFATSWTAAHQASLPSITVKS